MTIAIRGKRAGARSEKKQKLLSKIGKTEDMRSAAHCCKDGEKAMSAKNSNENQHFIIFKTEDRKIEVDVRFQGETVWLTLDQMAALFERDKSTISRHIQKYF